MSFHTRPPYAGRHARYRVLRKQNKSDRPALSSFSFLRNNEITVSRKVGIAASDERSVRKTAPVASGLGSDLWFILFQAAASR